MSVTATSQGAKAAHGLRQHIAETPQFQSACGVGNATAALPFIHLVGVYADYTLTYRRPTAIIYFPKTTHTIRSNSAGIVLEFELYKDVPEEYSPEETEAEADAFTDFYNFADQILEELVDQLDPRYGPTGSAKMIGAQVEWVSEMVRSRATDPRQDFISARFQAQVGRKL